MIFIPLKIVIDTTLVQPQRIVLPRRQAQHYSRRNRTGRSRRHSELVRKHTRYQLRSKRRIVVRVPFRQIVVRNGLVSLIVLVLSFAVSSQVGAWTSRLEKQTPLFRSPIVNVFHLPPLEIFWLSPEELKETAAQLFATPNSVGAIALGAAEGTRTQDGQKTAIWNQHIDPGNGAINIGTFSWQHEAATPEEADHKGLIRIQYEAIPYLIQAAERERVGFDIETLIQGADLWNQSPDAGVGFVKNLKRCLQQDLHYDQTILCARLESFYNPETGELEASGFDWDPMRLEQDQIRRMQAIKYVLQFNQNKLSVEY